MGTFTTDPVADMLTRVRNASMARKNEVFVPASTLKESLAHILEREGYVGGVAVEGDGKDRTIRIQLKYGSDRQATITGIKRVSRPGRRVYAGRDELPRVLGGLGIAILSTSQGLLTDRQAKKRGVGGEVLAYVW